MPHRLADRPGPFPRTPRRCVAALVWAACTTVLTAHAGPDGAPSLGRLLGGIAQEGWGLGEKPAPIPGDLRYRMRSLDEQAARAQQEDAATGRAAPRPPPMWREVLLSRRIEPDELTTLGRQLFASTPAAPGARLTRLHYFLESGPDDEWATQEKSPPVVPLGRSNFLTIFYGQTQSEHQRLLATSNAVPGQVVGIWVQGKKDGEKHIVFRNAEGVFIRHIASHGAARTQRYTVRSDRGHTLLHSVDNDEFGGFYVINLNGRLEIWAKDFRADFADPVGAPDLDAVKQLR